MGIRTDHSFREIPSVHKLVEDPKIKILSQELNRDIVVKTIRTVLAEVRAGWRLGEKPDLTTLSFKIIDQLEKLKVSRLKRVINATGVLIHTNLGRAPLSSEALEKVFSLASHYSTIEYDLEKGARGERNEVVEKLLCVLTGAEAALVVNNNAAAILLCLNTLAEEKEVLVSRGELVEIGNSFRVPEIMAKSGAKLKEIGTTNKTKLSDYKKGVNHNTALILKVHTSNYEIVGFTEEVSLKDLVKLSLRVKKPLLFDAGSGLCLRELSHFREPLIQDVVKAGVGLVMFSGDKLLGGPQSGIIVGKKKWIERLIKNPLYRTLRTDKIVLGVLEETLRHYLCHEETQKIPFLKMLFTPLNELEKKANEVKKNIIQELGELSFVNVEEDISKIGGGSFPSLDVPTVVLSFFLPKEKLIDLETSLRFPKNSEMVSVIGRIQKGRYLIDFRTIFDSDIPELKKALVGILSKNLPESSKDPGR